MGKVIAQVSVAQGPAGPPGATDAAGPIGPSGPNARRVPVDEHRTSTR
jgi:hypothetical protein